MVRPAMNFILRMLVIAWKGNYINKQNPDNAARSKGSTGFLSYGVFMVFRGPVQNKRKRIDETMQPWRASAFAEKGGVYLL